MGSARMWCSRCQKRLVRRWHNSASKHTGFIPELDVIFLLQHGPNPVCDFIYELIFHAEKSMHWRDVAWIGTRFHTALYD